MVTLKKRILTALFGLLAVIFTNAADNFVSFSEATCYLIKTILLASSLMPTIAVV